MPSALDLISKFAGGAQGLALSTGMQALMGLGQIAGSIEKNKEAKKIGRSIVDVDYEVQDPILNNQALAENRASQGLSDIAYRGLSDNTNRALTASVDAILRGAGSVNNISDLYDTSEDSYIKTAMIDEEIRLKNTAAYMQQNEKLANELDKEFQINEWAPNQDKKQLVAELRGQAQQQKGQGLSLVGGAVNNFVTGSMFSGEATGSNGGGSYTPNVYIEAARRTQEAGRALGIKNIPARRDIPYRQPGAGYGERMRYLLPPVEPLPYDYNSPYYPR